MKKGDLTVCLFVIWCFGVVPCVLAEAKPPDFPLDKGTSWVYRGETKYLVPKENATPEEKDKGIANKPKTEILTWKMEVQDTIERPNIFAALIKGGPWDLAWYEPGKERGTYVILRAKELRYYLYSGESAEKVWTQLQETSPGRIPSDMVEGELILDFPMVEGKVYGGESDFQVALHERYGWVVQGEREIGPKEFPGAEKPWKAREYDLVYRTGPDHQMVSFVTGIGIIGYSYGHHGTLSDTNLKLIRFVKGTPKAKAD